MDLPPQSTSLEPSATRKVTIPKDLDNEPTTPLTRPNSVTTPTSPNTPAHHAHITRDRANSTPQDVGSVLSLSIHAVEGGQDHIIKCFKKFQNKGIVCLQDVSNHNKVEMLTILDAFNVAKVNRLVTSMGKALCSPCEINKWELSGSSSNLFTLSPCEDAFMLTTKVPANESDEILELYRKFNAELTAQGNDFLSNLLCIAPLVAEGVVVHRCLFLPTSLENWETFRSSKLFEELKTSLLQYSLHNYPSFDQIKVHGIWNEDGIEIQQSERTPRLHTLEQASESSPGPVSNISKFLSSTRQDLQRFESFLEDRHRAIDERVTAFTKCRTTGKSDTFLEAARFGLKFGCVRADGGVIFRDWVVGDVDKVVVRGEFSAWEDREMTLEDSDDYGYHTWSYFVADKSDGTNDVVENTKYQFKFIKDDEVQYRVPAYASQVHIDESNGHVDAKVQFGCTKSALHRHAKPAKLSGDSSEVPIVYECHVGTSTNSELAVGSFKDFQLNVLPRVIAGGYNTICFMGLSQGSSYSTFGWHVTSHYAPDSAFGTPEDLHHLIDACHSHNIRVWVSLVHSHCAPIAGGGLQNYQKWGGEGEGYCPQGGAETFNKRFDAKKFALERHEVLRYLLGSITMWADNYRVDGIRLENLHMMLFHHQGLGYDFGAMAVEKHFNHEADLSSHVYIALCSMLCSELGISITGTTECDSPLLTHPIDQGGLGLDFIFSTAAQKIIQRVTDDCFNGLPIDQLAEMAGFEKKTGNRTILSASNWDSNIYARRTLKIAMLSWETLYTHPVGGVAPHVTELAAGLARLGHEVHIFTRSTTQTANHSIYHGVHVHECPMQLNSDFVQEIRNMCGSLNSHLLQTERYMNDNFSIVHAHDWLAAPALDGLKELGRTTIQTMHSTEYGRCGNQIFGGQSKAVRDVEGRGCDYADRVICVSGVLADEVKEHYHVHPEKIRVVYNGINAMNWDGFEDAAEIKARYGISAMQPMLLFVGRMCIQKGPDLLVEALPEIVSHRNDVVVVMVGDGHMLDGLKAKTDSMGLSGNVKWLGKKGGAELHSLYKACDAVLVPSRNEPFGIVVLEAWACYKPVVATTCGGPRDFVSNDIEGYLVDPNPGSVAWGVKQILSNFEHSRWMGERGRVKAAFSFTWDRIANETRDVYLELINRQDAPYGVQGFRSKVGEKTLISRLAGPLLTCRMSVFDQCDEVQRGIDMYNMVRLFLAMSSTSGHMGFMGTEFGQPDILDLPRPGNHFSKRNAKVDWDLSTATDLKFKYLNYFNARMNEVIEIASRDDNKLINSDAASSTIVVQKGSLIGVFNFGSTSFDEFNVGHLLGPDADLKIIMSSCEERYSGRVGYNDLNRSVSTVVPEDGTYMGCPNRCTISLHDRSAVVLCDMSKTRIELSDLSVDQWIEELVLKLNNSDESVPTKTPVSEKRDGPLRNRI